MNEWERCKKRFPNRTTVTEPEKDHISIIFEDHFTATDQGWHFLFVLLSDVVIWSAGPTHPWRYLDNNDLVSEELSQPNSSIRNISITCTHLKELGSTKEKKSSTPHKEIVGHTSIIGQFTSMVLVSPKPWKAQQMMTPPGLNNYWKELKQLSPR